MQTDWKDARPRYNVFRLLIGLGCGATMFSQLRVLKFISASKRVLVSTCYDMNLAFVYVKDKVSGHYKNVELQASLHLGIFPACNLCRNFNLNEVFALCDEYLDPWQLLRFRRSRDANETCGCYALDSLKNLLPLLFLENKRSMHNEEGTCKEILPQSV